MENTITVIRPTRSIAAGMTLRDNVILAENAMGMAVDRMLYAKPGKPAEAARAALDKARKRLERAQNALATYEGRLRTIRGRR